MSGGCNYRELIELRNQIGAMARGFRGWLEQFLLKEALIVLANTKRNTPEDTGWLRDSWYIGEIKRTGDRVEVYIINDTEYASFVEYGHVTRNRAKWIDGFFMCTLAIEDVQRKMPAKFNREFSVWVRSLGAEAR